MHLRSLILAGTAAAALIATPASAAIMMATWSSTIVKEVPKFGSGDDDEPVKLVVEMVYDTQAGKIGSETDDFGTYQRLSVSKEADIVSPFVSAKVTYGDTVLEFAPDTGMVLDLGVTDRDIPFVHARMLQREPLPNNGEKQTIVDFMGISTQSVPTDFNQPFAIDFFGETRLQFFTDDLEGPPAFFEIIGYANQRDPGHLTVVQLAPDRVGGGAVPEPATWALMIAGFGMAGAALRRRAVVTTA